MTETTKLGLFTYDVKNGLGLIGYNVDDHEGLGVSSTMLQLP